jgi:hypothetical protein
MLLFKGKKNKEEQNKKLWKIEKESLDLIFESAKSMFP